MALTVEKRELVFGAQSFTTAFAQGHPGAPFKEGSWIQIPRSAATLRAPYKIDDKYIITGQSDGNPVAQRLDFAPRINEGPVSCISIAPDSPIHSVDMMVGDISHTARHRITPGAPFYGDLTGINFALVAPVEAIPRINDLSGPLPATRAWDAREVQGSDGVVFAWPVRLNLYRGAINGVLHNQRAPLVAFCTADGDATFYFCVSGRERFDVIVQPVTGAAATVAVRGFDATLSGAGTDGTMSRTNVTLDTGIVAAAATPYVRSYQGNPFWGLVVELTATTGGSTVVVKAWDY